MGIAIADSCLACVLRTEHVEALDDRDGLAAVARALLDHHLGLLLLLDFAAWQLLHLLLFPGRLGACQREDKEHTQDVSDPIPPWRNSNTLLQREAASLVRLP